MVAELTLGGTAEPWAQGEAERLRQADLVQTLIHAKSDGWERNRTGDTEAGGGAEHLLPTTPMSPRASQAAGHWHLLQDAGSSARELGNRPCSQATRTRGVIGVSSYVPTCQW